MTSRVRGLLAILAQQVPTVLVLAALAGIFVWGASNEWRLPSPSAWGKTEEKKEEKPSTDGDPAMVLDDDGASRAGLEYAAAKKQALSQYVEAPAVLAFDHDLYAQLAPRAAGTAWRVLRASANRSRRVTSSPWSPPPPWGRPRPSSSAPIFRTRFA